MAEPVNLNRFKKAKARAENKARAEQNSVTYGRSKTEKSVDKANIKLAERKMANKKREP